MGKWRKFEFFWFSYFDLIISPLDFIVVDEISVLLLDYGYVKLISISR